MAITQITTHVADAQARTWEQYRKSPGVMGLIAVFAGRTQVVENALWAILSQRSLAVAVGQQLDNLGKVIGLARADVAGASDDAVYRSWLQAQILCNTSSGTVLDLAGICEAVCPAGTTIDIFNSGPASIVVRLGGAAQTQPVALSQMLQAAAAGGVHIVLEFLSTDPAHSFTFDGSTAQALDNGLFAGAI